MYNSLDFFLFPATRLEAAFNFPYIYGDENFDHDLKQRKRKGVR